MILRAIIVAVLLITGLFIKPFQPGTIDFIFRLFVLAVSGYVFYDLMFRQKPAAPKVIPLQADQDETVKIVKVLPKEITEKELDGWELGELLAGDEKIKSFVSDQFNIIAEIIRPDNGWLLYKYSNNEYQIILKKRFVDGPFEADSSNMASSGFLRLLEEREDILVENAIKDAPQAIPFYEKTEYKPGSFLGIPVKINERERLLFAFDCLAEKQFNAEDKPILKKISENLIFTLHNRLKNVKFLLDLRNQQRMNHFSAELIAAKTIGNAYDKMVQALSVEIKADRITVSVVKPNSQNGIIKRIYGQPDDYKESSEFNLQEGLTGWVIEKNKPYLIEDMVKGDYFIPRYSKNEKTNFGFRSFLGLPLGSNNQIVGAVTLESTEKNKFTADDKQLALEYIKVFNAVYKRYAN